jgi:hypothetical protein
LERVLFVWSPSMWSTLVDGFARQMAQVGSSRRTRARSFFHSVEL